MTGQDNRKDKLVASYEQMLERIRQTLDKTEKTLEHALSDARETAIELGELTRDEAEQVAAYVKRDLQDMAQYLEERGQDLDTWFHIDLELIEARLKELIFSVADPTRVGWAEMSTRANEGERYHTGEVSGPGTLQCVACGKQIEFHAAGRIPPCPQCHATEFRRLRGADVTDEEQTD